MRSSASSSLPVSPSGAEATMAACSVHQHLQSAPAWLLLAAAVGLLALLRLSLSLLRWIYVTFLRPGKNLRSYGSWAVVTGSTDGIGRAYALQFARKGLNLVLVGRNPDKLRDVSEAVRQKNAAVRVETVLIDFASDLVEGVARLRAVVRGLDVGILVNNAGISYPYAKFFHEVDEELLRNLIKVNVEGTTRVTQAVLPGMLERKRGAIVNMGTGAAVMIPSYPLYSVYAGTKSYIEQFSRCLHMEYKDKGIDVQCQMPLYVATKMTSLRKTSFIVSSPDGYARAALRWIGYEPRCTPYWPHSFMWFLFSLLPVSFLNQQCLSYSLNIRKKRQLKDAKKKEH